MGCSVRQYARQSVDFASQRIEPEIAQLIAVGRVGIRGLEGRLRDIDRSKPLILILSLANLYRRFDGDVIRDSEKGKSSQDPFTHYVHELVQKHPILLGI